MLKISGSWKAIVAGAAAGTASLSTALQDGTLTAGELLGVLAALLGGAGLTWFVPNKQPGEGG
ncbi:hypothetical protein [Streptomyces sp. HGB0020]|uniref:hypothetical protein n=1 Tax=Streptomyces sp. HGB0020 TaxID=1078086 RepID=UPI00034E8619|nr:hypothetical protein [Streptomyces sp. HGB0020]EPD63189.1 hypothetical protein HMPREF1211_03530 [Streptomyces sp. HGB0020]